MQRQRLQEELWNFPERQQDDVEADRLTCRGRKD